MRKRALILALLLMAPSAGFAAGPSAEDKLFAELKKADSTEAAKPIEDKLTQLFRASAPAAIC